MGFSQLMTFLSFQEDTPEALHYDNGEIITAYIGCMFIHIYI